MTHSGTTTCQRVVAWVCIKESHREDTGNRDELIAGLKVWVGDQIGAIARPSEIHIVEDLPKTRSGKIMRRLLQDLAEGRSVGDTQTLADTRVMSTIQDQMGR